MAKRAKEIFYRVMVESRNSGYRSVYFQTPDINKAKKVYHDLVASGLKDGYIVTLEILEPFILATSEKK